MLNTKQVAEKLGTPAGTVYRYIYSGILPAHKLGGNGKSKRHWHIKEVDLEAFINGHEAGQKNAELNNKKQSEQDSA